VTFLLAIVLCCNSTCSTGCNLLCIISRIVCGNKFGWQCTSSVASWQCMAR